MSFYDNATAIKNKIETALVDKNLVLTVRETYPATLIIRQSQSPYAQMELMAFSEDGVSSKDSALRFIFEIDGLKIHTDNRLIITDEFMNKLKNMAKKWHNAYTFAYFAEHTSGSRDCSSDNDTRDTVIDTDLVEDDEDNPIVSEDGTINEDVEIDADVDDIDDTATDGFSAAGPAEDPFADFMDDDPDISGLLGDE